MPLREVAAGSEHAGSIGCAHNRQVVWECPDADQPSFRSTLAEANSATYLEAAPCNRLMVSGCTDLSKPASSTVVPTEASGLNCARNNVCSRCAHHMLQQTYSLRTQK